MDELALLQVDLVRASGVSEATVRPVMRGKPGNYRTAGLGKIARALGWTSDSIKRILDGDEPIRQDQVVRSTVELQGAGPDLVIELPAGTEFDEGDTVYVVVEVKGGSPLAEQLLANAPWAETKEAADATLAEANRLIEQGHVIEVKIAGHDAPATVIATTNFDKFVEDQLRLAAREGTKITPEARDEVARQAREALAKARTKPKTGGDS